MPALKEIMPNAHVRNCVMHMWKNFINRFKDLYIREIVWDCAKCTTVAESKTRMDRLKEVDQDSWSYLMKFEPSTWVRAYFSHGPKVDNLTNNMCESFNSKITKYRCKPILTMCEEVRCYLMRRMVQHKRLIDCHHGKLAPVQEKGMPCTHAVAAIKKRHDNMEDYVHPWLCMESLKKTYEHFIQPVTSEEFWIRSYQTRPAAPVIKRPIGHSKVHNRQKDPAETVIECEKLRRSFYVTCSKCGQTGHNYKTCKGAPSNPNWKLKTRKPKKKIQDNLSLVVIPLSQSALEAEGEEHDSATPTNQNHSTTSTTPDVAQQQPAP
ncbi:uncharacterized protein [Arachis hypogaea]|uniref:uncharacterized protein n=1 Tax=Arachis hypogaea TaxID=3818 RepID=UPI003B21EFE9